MTTLNGSSFLRLMRYLILQGVVANKGRVDKKSAHREVVSSEYSFAFSAVAVGSCFQALFFCCCHESEQGFGEDCFSGSDDIGFSVFLAI